MYIKSRIEKLERISLPGEDIHVCSGEPMSESDGIIRAVFNDITMLREDGESLCSFVSRVDDAVEARISRKRTETVSILFYGDLEGNDFGFMRLKMFLDPGDMAAWKKKGR